MLSPQDVRSLILVLTAQCNLRCSYCYQTAKNSRRMDWATLRASIDFVLDSKARAVKLMFIGGEPLLMWQKLRRAVYYTEQHSVGKKQVNYAVSTNGLLITDQVAAFLDKHKFQIHLSFDGIAEVQDFRCKGTFAAVDRLLDRLRKKHRGMFDYRLQVCVTLIPPAVPYLAESIRYLIGKGVREISVSPSLTPHQGWTDDCRTQFETQFATIWDFSLSHFERTGEVPLLPFRHERTEKKRRPRTLTMCNVMSGEEILIDVDGQAHGCPMFAESYQEIPTEFLRKRVGALRLGDFRDPCFGQRFAHFPEAISAAEIFDHKEKKYSSYRKCGECEFLDSCSLCPVSIGYDPENTDPHRVPDFLCAYHMAELKYRARFPTLPDPIERLESIIRWNSRKAPSALS